jgi:hypothetical protein
VIPGQRLGLARVELHAVTNVYGVRECAGTALKNLSVVRGRWWVALPVSPTCRLRTTGC